MAPDDKITGRAKGGVARAEALPRERRQEIAKKAAEARWGGPEALEKVVFVAPEDGRQFEVLIDEETVWLTPKQMAELFGRAPNTIRKHVAGVFADGELEEANNAQKMSVNRRGKPDTAYTLDVIISVGYRVKSPMGVGFRRWATRTLKDRLVTDLRRRRQREALQLQEMRDALRIARAVTDQEGAGAEEAKAILDVIERYSRSWSLLVQYDEDRLPTTPARPSVRIARLTLIQARQAIVSLKKALIDKGEASELFGQERGDALAGILGNIEQSFGGESLYPTAEVRAANLLYFVIKDHPFTDGNKRIASLLFIYYLDKNGFLDRADGQPLFDDNALVALALLIAQSNPNDRELMTRLVIGLLGDHSSAAASSNALPPPS